MIRLPIARCISLTIVMMSGTRIVQDVWSYDIRHLDDGSDVVLGTSYVWTSRNCRARIVRADRIEAIVTSRGPLRWRGWRA